jgi:hypothetical protein
VTGPRHGLPLTVRQREILDFIAGSVDSRGYPPTIHEIGEHFGIRSTNGVRCHLEALERKGFLLRGSGSQRRAMTVVKPINGTAAGWSYAGPLGSMLSVRMEEQAGIGSVAHRVVVSIAAPEGVLTDIWTVTDGMTRSEFAAGVHAAALRLLAHELLEQQRLDGAKVWIPHAQGGAPVMTTGESMWVGPTQTSPTASVST